MTGNILYIPYTIFMIIGLIILLVVIKIKKGNKATINYLIILLPVFVLFQFYFWNLEFNDYVKSYLFPSKVFECKYEEELKNIPIPLPDRTVFKGKENICSPIYLSYVKDNDFKSFYQEELMTLRDKGKIHSFSYIERKDSYRTESKGFEVDLKSGSKIEVFIHRGEGSGFLTIDFEPIK